MNVVYILLIVLLVAFTAIAAPALQLIKAFNPEHFLKIKINYLWFMFRGTGTVKGGYSSSKEYGVILPMFAIQLLGYVAAIVFTVITIVLSVVAGIGVVELVFINLYAFLSVLIISAVTIFVCAIISYHKAANTQPKTEEKTEDENK